MVQEAVEHGADRGRSAQQFTPVLDGTVRGQERTGPLVAPHDDLQQLFGCGQGQLAHSEVMENQKGHGHQGVQILFTSAIQGCLREFIQEGVGLAIENAIALLDSRLPDGLSQVTLAGAWWT